MSSGDDEAEAEYWLLSKKHFHCFCFVQIKLLFSGHMISVMTQCSCRLTHLRPLSPGQWCHQLVNIVQHSAAESQTPLSGINASCSFIKRLHGHVARTICYLHNQSTGFNKLWQDNLLNVIKIKSNVAVPAGCS